MFLKHDASMSAGPLHHARSLRPAKCANKCATSSTLKSFTNLRCVNKCKQDLRYSSIIHETNCVTWIRVSTPEKESETRGRNTYGRDSDCTHGQNQMAACCNRNVYSLEIFGMTLMQYSTRYARHPDCKHTVTQRQNQSGICHEPKGHLPWDSEEPFPTLTPNQPSPRKLLGMISLCSHGWT